MSDLRIDLARAEHAQAILAVQRAAFAVEAERNHAPTIPPLTESVDAVLGDIADPGTVGRRSSSSKLAVRLPTSGPRR